MSQTQDPGWPEKTVWPRFQKKRHVSLWMVGASQLEECQVCGKPSTMDPEHFSLYAGGIHGLKMIEKQIRDRFNVLIGFVCPHCKARNLFSEKEES